MKSIRTTTELLKDESSDLDLVGPTLPVLKALCDRGFNVSNVKVDLLPKVVNGMLSACLQNVEDMRLVDSILTSYRFATNLFQTL